MKTGSGCKPVVWFGVLVAVCAVTVAMLPATAAAGSGPQWVHCGPDADGWVADLRHVGFGTACSLTEKIARVQNLLPRDKSDRINRFCWNPFKDFHRFHGWTVLVPMSVTQTATMRRGRASFEWEIQDGPLSCV
jgi:hypothetical protein